MCFIWAIHTVWKTVTEIDQWNTLSILTLESIFFAGLYGERIFIVKNKAMANTWVWVTHPMSVPLNISSLAQHMVEVALLLNKTIYPVAQNASDSVKARDMAWEECR